MSKLGNSFPGNETFSAPLSEMPDDLMEGARRLAMEVRDAVDGCTCADCLVVAHEVALTALLNERERCAKIAELPDHSALNIAAAIRKGGAA